MNNSGIPPISQSAIIITQQSMQEETIAYLDRRIHLLQRELDQTRSYARESGDQEAVERLRILRVKIERAVQRLRRMLEPAEG